MSLREYLRAQQARVDEVLHRIVPKENEEPTTIHKAMRYSLFAGGKRIRPILCIAAANALGRGEPSNLLEIASTLELIHTYSLIHDDLPALDNDDLRRGRPTCHKVFGEAMAILAGDSLLTHAFIVLGEYGTIRLVGELASASGTLGGMIGGQVHDIEGEGRTPTEDLLEQIHRAKTGALLRCSVRMGAIAGGASDVELDALSRYGEHVGLAFQIVDDILDVEQSTEQLGKTAGKDAAQQKITFPAVYGLEKSHQMAESERSRARSAMEPFGQEADPLRELADMIVYRKA